MESWRPRSEKWLLLAPALLILSAITLWPLAQTLWLSFTDAEITAVKQPIHWIGFDNYVYALTDPDFQDALSRTLYFTIVSVGLETVIGVAVALLLNLEFKGRTFARMLIVLPWALPNIVNAMMWRLIYHPEYGALNALLVQTGILSDYRSWLGEPGLALHMVIFADVWKNFPLIAFVALAALQTIPRELFEAARVEGAGAWHQFKAIVLSAIIGPVLVIVILRTVEAFRVFDIIYVMTRGGPADSTKTASFFVYQEYFSYLRAGSGASYAAIVAAISAVLIAIYLGAVRRQAKAAA
ncbi:carbohydrate ABC transporter permease [Segnochrobactrum spirostomi]|uniref:Sugar ABC transporter permease n=1 Tax=Segnochrobactrum spirostomi TaxID=2608987 RepID=A0A6A7Y8G8_9HYPH|nr:sugar ABC transporter permease [Segnochrobactrum spirostomi]MQT15015.1 sugar ABC transporter permease [Segnochrobactrum spirostomi]